MVDQVTEARVLDLFAQLGATAARRYELPKLQALNFVIENALQGGVNASLGLDRHGKTLSYLLLSDLEVEAPWDLVPPNSPYRRMGDPDAIV